MTGNLWFKDWMKFITQFRQIRLHQQDPFPDSTSVSLFSLMNSMLIGVSFLVSHRALGHSLQHSLSSFRVTGDFRVLDQMAVYLRKDLAPTTDPYHGDSQSSGFQTGYLTRWNSNYYHGTILLNDSDNCT